MTTKLHGPLKRELQIGKTAYVLTISPEGFKLTAKGKRKGIEIGWQELVTGDAAMAVALRASLNLPARSKNSKQGQRSVK